MRWDEDRLGRIDWGRIDWGGVTGRLTRPALLSERGGEAAGEGNPARECVPPLWTSCRTARNNATRYTMVHQYNIGTSWYTMVHGGIRWYTMVHGGIRWYTMVHDGIRWCTMVHDGIRWYVYPGACGGS